MVVAPNHHSIPTVQSPSSLSADDLELRPIKTHKYSSLRDLLPQSPVNSPAALARPDIRIRNRLVEQAACAYLRPASITPDFDGGNCCQRLWNRAAAFVDFVCGWIIRALDGTLRFFRVRISRTQRV
ncbi:hypothetical protein ABFS82_10G059700 [Erythranthe guttata]|uniref:Uncharacterized protein n=1 Tax=Erythranthe guttata TaxID=4155 RepID=A0A022PV42_ERYGU|nr:hypothetical protein MIMGU_mgv1a016320mg [Erythranthe guttata]